MSTALDVVTPIWFICAFVCGVNWIALKEQDKSNKRKKIAVGFFWTFAILFFICVILQMQAHFVEYN
jgi:hypothetical protein